jgi:serine protease Do
MFNWSRRKQLMAFAAALFMGGAVFGYYFARPLAFTSSHQVLAPEAMAQSKEITNGVFTKIAKESMPSVVNISTKQKVKSHMLPEVDDERTREFYERFFPGYKDMPKEQVKQSLGSGFVVEEDGHILTNSHVIDQADEIIVSFGDGHDATNATEYTAKIIGQDPKTDIAIIKIQPDKKIMALKMGDSDNLQVAEWVMAIGNPFGFSQSVTVGVVSAKGRVIGAGPYDEFIQTDASINPGNSGGPLLNLNGEVVGINSAIFTGGSSQGNIGIGFAIPINAVKSIYNDLKKGKVNRGWLGVMIQKITPELMNALGLKTSKGALVGDVQENSPASKAGIKRGDIITEFNGLEVPASEQLPKMVASVKPNTKVKVKLLRDGIEKSITLSLGELPDEAVEKPAPQPSEDKLGISVEKLTDELAKQLNALGASGVVVRGVLPNGSAANAGIHVGDIITEVNKTSVKDVASYNSALGKSKPGESVLFLIKRGKTTVFVAVKLPEK